MIPNILTIAGSDPSGGAGIQADIKTISANGGYAMAAITALTAQNTRGVQAVHLMTPDIVAAQIASIFADIRVDAVKLGMLGSADIIEVVRDALAGRNLPIVLDPVMVAKSGDRLLAPEAVSALREGLLPLATVITPNLPEAADLLGWGEAKTLEEMQVQAERLLALGPQAVLLKGGHLLGVDSPDLVLSPDHDELISSPRIATLNTHGTGCSFAAALATHLAHGKPLIEAAQAAKTYVTGAIAASGKLTVGSGHGPLHHFHALKGDNA